MQPIDLIALDLDGTLLNSDEHVSLRNRAAIKRALDAGIRVVLVTGRGVDVPARIALDLGLNVPVICAHGALTKDFVAHRTLGHLPVPLVHAKPLVEHAERHDLDLAIYTSERFYRLHGKRVYMADMTGPGWHAVGSFAPLLEEAPTFLRFLGRDSVQAVRERFAHLPLHFKHETWGAFEECAVTSLEATKENALRHLCDHLRIPASRVLALGDSRNDVPMLRWAGVGVAMENALPEVKAAVTHVTARHDADGVALAIERFVLAPRRERSA